jgi:hypothetical protein
MAYVFTKKNTILDVMKCKEVVISDHSNYDPDRCNNGGAYSFHVHFVKEGGSWKVRYSTSADFEYCDITGSFNKCGNSCPHFDYHSDKCTAQYEQAMTGEVLNAIAYADQAENMEVTIR